MMSDIAEQRPRFSAVEAMQIAANFFGRHAVKAKPLPSDRDQNFYLEEKDGSVCVLKIAGAAEDEAVLDMQNKALAHLAQSAVAGLMPRLYPSSSGQNLVQVDSKTGRHHFVRLLDWKKGVPLAEVNPHPAQLLRHIGRVLGQMDQALLDFRHPALKRKLAWDMKHAAEIVGRNSQLIADAQQRDLVTMFLNRFREHVLSRLPNLRCSAIHNDGNDYNFLVSEEKKVERRLTGIIDFGDMVGSYTVFEIAVAAAYIMLNKADPFRAASTLVAGYHTVLPLTDLELTLLPHLVAMRLCTSVVMSARQQVREPDNRYLSISERPAWNLLEKLASMPPLLFEIRLRKACELVPYPGHDNLVQWLEAHKDQFAPLLPVDLRTEGCLVFDWSVGSLAMGNPEDFGDPQQSAEKIESWLASADVQVGVGQYNEARLVYTTDQFQEGAGEWRTIHIGMDFFMPPATPVYAPLDGVVHSFRDNDLPRDYGPTIILRHDPPDGPIFYTLYGHLSRESLFGLETGVAIKKGQEFCQIGDIPVNGGWSPHLHFQIMGDLLGNAGNFPGAAAASWREEWLSLCPDPSLIVGIPADRFLRPDADKEALLAGRREHLGSSLSISYQKPLHILRGRRQYLYDQDGRPYLDVVNNVAHVGHSHPHVVNALARQAAVLNTNTRYLHPNIVSYAERLLALFPKPLEVCFFVCSGSEANELALRLARTYTQAEDLIVLDGAYHGNTQALIDSSPYKHDGPGGKGTPAHVHKVLMPDPYRGPYKGYTLESGRRYADHIAQAAQEVTGNNEALASFICESLLGCGGQIVLPEGTLALAFDHVRAAGGVCIADEVQVGFGRVGTHFWGFETQGVVPDIVTMGKPMGNGHPLAAVVTTREIADAFANGMEYFNTFGGNPVSCAVGSAVLDVIEGEGLQGNARHVGQLLRRDLQDLMDRHAIIGDVRGLGLFIGVELVRDRETLEPAATEATYIVERMKEEGILLSIDGPLHNVLKLKPPLVFNEENSVRLVKTLDKILAEDPAQI